MGGWLSRVPPSRLAAGWGDGDEQAARLASSIRLVKELSTLQLGKGTGQKHSGLLKPKLWNGHCHLQLILVVKASHKAAQIQVVGRESTSSWEEVKSQMQVGADSGWGITVAIFAYNSPSLLVCSPLSSMSTCWYPAWARCVRCSRGGNQGDVDGPCHAEPTF